LNYNNTITQQEWEEIENYLSGEMEAAEHEAFRAKLSDDPLLREKLKEVQLTTTGIREAGLTEKIKEWNQEADRTKITFIPERKLKTMWLAAASIILVAVTAFFWFNKETQGEKLYAQYYEADPGLATAMSVSDNYDFNRGMIDYKTGKYTEAINAWRPLLANQPGNDTLHYFTGLSFLALNESDSAVHHLQQTIAAERSNLLNEARWYLALAFLKKDKIKEAEPLIRQSTHPQKEKLLSELE
jgi:tetratricopeptide (TPR) repeat protein